MAHMNGGFEKHGLDDDAFGPKGGLSHLKTFDAFRKDIPLISSLRSPRNHHFRCTRLTRPCGALVPRCTDRGLQLKQNPLTLLRRLAAGSGRLQFLSFALSLR